MKKKKHNPKVDPGTEKEKEVKAEEFTDKGTAYEDDENQLYPEVRE